ncbi:MAG: hypothetical protein ACI807_003590 [Paracoccaceae bacterium]|jgi:hypothetical protein
MPSVPVSGSGQARTMPIPRRAATVTAIRGPALIHSKRTITFFQARPKADPPACCGPHGSAWCQVSSSSDQNWLIKDAFMPLYFARYLEKPRAHYWRLLCELLRGSGLPIRRSQCSRNPAPELIKAPRSASFTERSNGSRRVADCALPAAFAAQSPPNSAKPVNATILSHPRGPPKHRPSEKCGLRNAILKLTLPQ